MHHLSIELLKKQDFQAQIPIDIPKKFHFPEKIVQFGTGILLRGLPDFFVHQANQAGIFEGSILVVKSTEGSAEEFEKQNGLFTTVVQGVENGEMIDKYLINSAISRVVSAKDSWKEILHTAQNTLIQIVISNTTEVGIQYVEESIFQNPPYSFPAKLTAWLYERFEKLGNHSPEVVIIPTELISNNGKKLQEIVFQLIELNNLGDNFKKWIAEKVIFCSSLVDRIVTGMPEKSTAQEIFSKLGFEDRILLVTEPYKLWAIEGNNRAREILSFAKADSNVIIEEDISFYRERKLRILNGSHTIGVCKGFLNGFDTVLECMQDAEMSRFFKEVIENEIAPSISNAHAPIEKIKAFSCETIERFQNPYLKHFLLNITLQCTSKMRMRNVPTILRYYEKFGKIPEKMTEGFAYYLRFMKSEEIQNGQYYGQRAGEKYWIQDDAVSYFALLWKKVKPQNIDSLNDFVKNICRNTQLWEANLSQMQGFEETVLNYLARLV